MLLFRLIIIISILLDAESPLSQLDNQAEDGDAHRDDDGQHDGRGDPGLLAVVLLLGWKDVRKNFFFSF